MESSHWNSNEMDIQISPKYGAGTRKIPKKTILQNMGLGQGRLGKRRCRQLFVFHWGELARDRSQVPSVKEHYITLKLKSTIIYQPKKPPWKTAPLQSKRIYPNAPRMSGDCFRSRVFCWNFDTSEALCTAEKGPSMVVCISVSHIGRNQCRQCSGRAYTYLGWNKRWIWFEAITLDKSVSPQITEDNSSNNKADQTKRWIDASAHLLFRPKRKTTMTTWTEDTLSHGHGNEVKQCYFPLPLTSALHVWDEIVAT